MIILRVNQDHEEALLYLLQIMKEQDSLVLSSQTNHVTNSSNLLFDLKKIFLDVSKSLNNLISNLSLRNRPPRGRISIARKSILMKEGVEVLKKSKLFTTVN